MSALHFSTLRASNGTGNDKYSNTAIELEYFTMVTNHVHLPTVPSSFQGHNNVYPILERQCQLVQAPISMSRANSATGAKQATVCQIVETSWATSSLLGEEHAWLLLPYVMYGGCGNMPCPAIDVAAPSFRRVDRVTWQEFPSNASQSLLIWNVWAGYNLRLSWVLLDIVGYTKWLLSTVVW